MPRFYFDIEDGPSRARDDDGTMLPDAEEARKAAIGLLPNIARDELPDGDRRNFVATVRLEDGRVIFRATLSLVAEWLEPHAANTP